MSRPPLLSPPERAALADVLAEQTLADCRRAVSGELRDLHIKLDVDSIGWRMSLGRMRRTVREMWRSSSMYKALRREKRRATMARRKRRGW